MSDARRRTTRSRSSKVIRARVESFAIILHPEPPSCPSCGSINTNKLGDPGSATSAIRRGSSRPDELGPQFPTRSPANQACLPTMLLYRHCADLVRVAHTRVLRVGPAGLDSPRWLRGLPWVSPGLALPCL